MPKVSVIMSVYNAAPYLEESVQSILNQTESDFECIIIDDGSTDESKALLEKFAKKDSRIRLVSRGNKGLIFSLNEAISLAKSNYIARMDADDIADPARIEKQLEYMTKNNLSLLGTYAETINSSGEVMGEFTYPPRSPSLKFYSFFHNPFIHPSVMFTKQAINEAGGYRSFFKYVEDYELWTRFIFKYRSDNLPEFLLKYRIHENQITKKRHGKMLYKAFLVRFLAVLRYFIR